MNALLEEVLSPVQPHRFPYPFGGPGLRLESGKRTTLPEGDLSYVLDVLTSDWSEFDNPELKLAGLAAYVNDFGWNWLTMYQLNLRLIALGLERAGDLRNPSKAPGRTANGWAEYGDFVAQHEKHVLAPSALTQALNNQLERGQIRVCPDLREAADGQAELIEYFLPVVRRFLKESGRLSPLEGIDIVVGQDRFRIGRLRESLRELEAAILDELAELDWEGRVANELEADATEATALAERDYAGTVEWTPSKG